MKLRRLAIICLALVMLATGISAIKSAPVYAATITMVTEDLNTEELSLGDEYNFPASIQAEYNSQVKTFTNGVVVYPSGKTSLAGKKLVINEVGEYAVRYYYFDGSKRITAERKFMIKSKLYDLSKDDGSTIEVVKDNPVNTEEGYRNFTVSDGLKLSIKDGNEFVYNKVIDLRETVDNTGASKIAWFDPAHFTTTLNTATNDDGSLKFKDDKGANCYNLSDHQCDMVYFRITDAYDPSIYVDISVRANKGNFKAGGGNQVIASWDEAADPYGSATSTRVAFKSPDLPEGTLRLVRLTHNEHSQTSRPVDFKSSHNYYDGFKLYYDLETNRVLYTGVNVKQNGLNNTDGKDSGLYVINDLQMPEIYGEGKNGGYFPGFTTGEVRLSIFAANYYSSHANVDLIGVGNDEGKDLIANHGEFSYADTVAPDVKIDAELTDETGVYAAIGETYTIPAATATDVNLFGSKNVTDISVYRGYGTETRFDVPVTNGAFNIKYPDIYTIVYRARDTFGNVTEKTLNVTALKVQSGKALDFSVEKLTSIQAGKKSTLPAYTLTTINNQEKLWIKPSVLYNGEELALSEDGTFVPFYQGEYTIKYEYGDNCATKVYEYKVNCTGSDAAMFMDVPVEYRYFIPGKTYTLEPFYAYTFNTAEPQRSLAETWVKVDGKDAVKIEDISKYTVPEDAAQSIQFVYKYPNAEDYVSKEIPVQVISNQKEAGFITQFFAGEFTPADKTATQVRFDAKAISGNATLYYINPISLYNLNIRYIIPSGYDRYSAVKFTFTDYEDENNKITVRLVKDGNDCLVYFQDNPYVKAAEQFTAQLQKVISYDNRTEQFKIGSGITYDINFGFKSKMVYMEVELQDINCQTGENAGIIITEVGNQKINGKQDGDTTAPIAAIDETRGTYKPGDIITIYTPTIIDAVTPVLASDVYIKVTDKNGTVLKDVDTGVLLDMPTDGATSYRIKLETYGQYTVAYGIRSNVPASRYGKAFSPGKYSFSVIDTVKPEITFTDGYNEYSVVNVKYGESFKLNYTVSDNLTATEDIKVIMSALRHENQVTYYFIENATFTPTEKGTYTITISARDADNNIGRRTLKIVVA
ncbi:MAG: hypothetical protein IKV61_04670 [Clostridia bacterium]|nr:hypothetical protein [Clostridia bacterium]